MSEVTEILVVYFPPGEDRRTRKTKSLEEAQGICTDMADYAPLIQQRTVNYGPWVVIYNSDALDPPITT